MVAWPLLLLTLFDMSGHRKEMPEVLTFFMPLSLR